MTKEVLELALAELLECRSVDDNERGRHIAITAIEEELAQPEQEPVAWFRKLFSPEIGEFFDYKDGAFARETDSEGWTPLYTTPPQRKPMTDEEIEDLYFDKFSMGELKAFARAIEATHNIKE